MLRSIATVSLGGTLLDKLNAIAAAGFDGVEIFENDLLYFDGSPADVRRICQDLGLRILLFQPFRDFEATPRARMPKNFDRAEIKFDVMEQLGADLMLVCSNTAPDAIGDDAVAAEDLRALGERAARRGFRIGYAGRFRLGPPRQNRSAVPGRSCRRPTMPPSGWWSTRSTPARSRTTTRRSPTFRANASSSRSSPTRR